VTIADRLESEMIPHQGSNMADHEPRRELTRRRLKGIAGEALSEILSNREGVIGAFIYGSVAVGTPLPESDIDLTVLVDSSHSVKRSFRYYDRTPVDCIYAPKGWFCGNGLINIEPAMGMGLHYGEVLSDPQGILGAAQDYLRHHLFGPDHQGVWIAKTFRMTQKSLKNIEDLIQEENWIKAQIQLHEATVRLGRLIGYVARIPPDPVANLPKIREASGRLGMPHVYEICRQVYSLPSDTVKDDLRVFRESISEIYEIVLRAVKDSGKGEEEKENASPYSPERPNRWDYVATKLDRLLRASREEGYSGLVWAAAALGRDADRWIPHSARSHRRLLERRNRVLAAVDLTRELTLQRFEGLSDALEEVSKSID